jgi:hypothetical protein
VPINPPVSVNPTPYTALDIVKDAMIEVGMLSPGEEPDGESGQWAFRKLNYVMDWFSAQFPYAYNVEFTEYELVANLSPHTIGPGDGTTPATFTVEQRPIRIESAAIVLEQNGVNVDLPIPVEDDDWWAQNRIKDLTSTLPTHLYYSPNWPNGNLFFWPIPTVANGVRLETWVLLHQFNDQRPDQWAERGRFPAAWVPFSVNADAGRDTRAGSGQSYQPHAFSDGGTSTRSDHAEQCPIAAHCNL